MFLRKTWWEAWRGFLGLSADDNVTAVEILQRRFIVESQHVKRFKQHGERMQYPQFRERFLRMAADGEKHAQLIGEKISGLGGTLPAVPDIEARAGNNWHNLLADLEEHRLSAAELLDHVYYLRPGHPEIADMFLSISRDGEKHRAEIREMLMRSDPQALQAA